MGDRGPEAEALWAEAAVNKLMPPSGGYMHKIEGAGFDLPSFSCPDSSDVGVARLSVLDSVRAVLAFENAPRFWKRRPKGGGTTPQIQRTSSSHSRHYLEYDAFMFHRRIMVITVASVALAACASPTVDTAGPTFDEQQYTVDLNDCRGGTVIEVALSGLGGAVVGSAIGAFEGAIHGAWSGNSPEGAAIGAVVGGVFGVVVGAQEPIQEQEADLRRCLREKGYVLAS